MIVDQLSNIGAYVANDIVAEAIEFIRRVRPEDPDGRFPIRGDDVTVRIMSYATRTPAEAKLEAHRVFVDIQTTLSGAEGIEWFPRDALQPLTPYDDRKDVELFVRPGPSPCRVDVFPGFFALFFPADAHMPQLAVGAPARIRKAVVKVRADLLPRLPR